MRPPPYRSFPPSSKDRQDRAGSQHQPEPASLLPAFQRWHRHFCFRLPARVPAAHALLPAADEPRPACVNTVPPPAVAARACKCLPVQSLHPATDRAPAPLCTLVRHRQTFLLFPAADRPLNAARDLLAATPLPCDMPQLLRRASIFPEPAPAKSRPVPGLRRRGWSV